MGITLRLAFGSNGSMRSLRLVGLLRMPRDATVPAAWLMIPFELAPGEQLPPLVAMRPATPGAVTVERVTGADGVEVWSNPDARELLWNALGLGASPR
jgi:hypothetical protein